MRWWWISVPLLLSGCAPARPPLECPKQVGAWTLGSGSAVLNSRVSCSYDGPAPVTVDLEEFSSETVAFEAFQKLTVPPGSMPFYKGALLAIPKAADRAALETFSRQLRVQLK